MTDRPDTQQDLELTLATMHDQIVNAADPALLTEGARVRLGEMFTEAETRGDQGAMQLIQDAWNDITALATNETRAREIARSTMDIAQGYRSERDSMAKELKELSDAVDNMDQDHPQVADLIESVSEAINETEMLWWDDSVSESIYENLQAALGYGEEAIKPIGTLMDIIYQNIELTPARKREFFAWLDGVQSDHESGDDDDE